MITQDYLKSILKYDTDTGKFFWKITKGKIKEGTLAGTLHNAGYWSIQIDKKIYLAHRLAWLYIYGKLPTLHLDHIDHNRNNNSINNLREVTNQENHKNMKLHCKSVSNITGVHWNKKSSKWSAEVYHNGKKYFLGYFTSIEDAAKARQLKNEEFNFHKNHGATQND